LHPISMACHCHRPPLPSFVVAEQPLLDPPRSIRTLNQGHGEGSPLGYGQADDERGLSPSLSAPEPRYYAFYHEFCSGVGEPATAATTPCHGATQNDFNGGFDAPQDVHGRDSGAAKRLKQYGPQDDSDDCRDHRQRTKTRTKEEDSIVQPTRRGRMSAINRRCDLADRREVIRRSGVRHRPLPAATSATATTTNTRATTRHVTFFGPFH
jgi:hypothetical protein